MIVGVVYEEYVCFVVFWMIFGCIRKCIICERYDVVEEFGFFVC